MHHNSIIDGLKGFPLIILIECKNLTGNVPTRDVAFFITKLRNKGLDFGIIVASNGIMGSPNDDLIIVSGLTSDAYIYINLVYTYNR